MRSPSPPSKKRYDLSHPVVSFRTSNEDYARLKSVLGKQNKTIGEFFREALGIEQRSFNEAEERGYDKGFKAAKEKYAVKKNCIICGEPIIITNPRSKMIMAARYPGCLRHEDCELSRDPCISYPSPIVIVPRKRR